MRCEDRYARTRTHPYSAIVRGVAETAREPLVIAEDLRVDVEGLPTCDGLTLRTTGEHVLVLGAPRAFVEAASGLRPVVRGQLLVRGTPVACLLDPPMPPAWTPLEYATWSARLAGWDRREATARAREALAQLELTPMFGARLSSLVVHARRATLVASALATGKDTLLLEDPLAGLPEEASRTFARILVRALAGHAWVVCAPRVPLSSPLAMHADEALVVSTSRVQAQGAPAELAAAERRFFARVQGPVDGLAARLHARGASLDVQGTQVVFDLGDRVSTAELLGMCVAERVVVVELLPLARALA